MLYSQYFIDDLKNRADTVRIIKRYVPLKKKGANWMACCPFHKENTPSFSVHSGKGVYKCFGCGKGGNVYTFLMEIEGLSFPAAIRRVAEESGIPLPQSISDDTYQKNKEKKNKQKKLVNQIIELNNHVLKFWEDYLRDDNPQSKAARDYLAQREIDEKTIKKFRIGFAPDAWNTVLNLLKERGVDEELIKKSGLVSINEEKERIYDRFRGRIIFPVLDLNSNPLAFGGRTLGKDEPKYLNSPETPAYIKGGNLYGLLNNKEEIRRKNFSILVEGYMDLLTLHRFGIKNVVASLGTAFTNVQAKLLRRFARRVVVNYDGDSAGMEAARRAIKTLLDEDFDIKVMVLPDETDPDDFIRAGGAESYNLLRGNAYPYLQFALEQAVNGRDLTLPKQKAEAAEEVLQLLASVRDPIQKRESFDQTMIFFHIEDPLLRRDLWKTTKLGGEARTEKIKRRAARSPQAKMTTAERCLLSLLVKDDKLREEMLPLIEETDYERLASVSIFEALFRLKKADLDITPENLQTETKDDASSENFISSLFTGNALRKEGETIDDLLIKAENCLAALRSMAISERILTISRELKIAEKKSNSDAIARLVNEQIELTRMKRELGARISEN